MSCEYPKQYGGCTKTGFWRPNIGKQICSKHLRYYDPHTRKFKRVARRVIKKVWSRFFDDIESGTKNFDVRLNNFQADVGDTIVFKEFDELEGKLTGRKVEKKISYILNTKPLTFEFWKKEDIELHGYKVIGLEDLYRWCPIHQCGGKLHTRNAKYGKQDIQKRGDEITWQIPEMVCDNCKSVFRCTSFEKKPLGVNTQ
jgi:hypothetical protein